MDNLHLLPNRYRCQPTKGPKFVIACFFRRPPPSLPAPLQTSRRGWGDRGKLQQVERWRWWRGRLQQRSVARKGRDASPTHPHPGSGTRASRTTTTTMASCFSSDRVLLLVLLALIMTTTAGVRAQEDEGDELWASSAYEVKGDSLDGLLENATAVGAQTIVLEVSGRYASERARNRCVTVPALSFEQQHPPLTHTRV